MKKVVPFKLFKFARLDRLFEDRCCGEEMTSDEIRLVQAYRGCTDQEHRSLNSLATAMMLARVRRLQEQRFQEQSGNIGKPVMTIDAGDDREGA